MKNKYMENERLSLVLFFTVAVVYAVIYMTKNCYSAAMVHLVNENVLTKSQTGTINSVFYLVYAPFQIIGGLAADKYSPYKLIAIGILGAAISNLLILFVQNYYLILIIWAFNGAIQFGVWPGVFKIVSQSLAPTHRHNAVFYISFSSTIGLIMSYLLAGVVSGWKGNFIVSATSLFASFAIWLIVGKYLDRKMVDEDPVHHGTPHLPEIKKYDNKPTESFVPTLFKSGLIILLPVVVLKSVFALGAQSITPTMIFESYDNISPAVASVLTIIPVLAGLAGKFIMQAVYSRKIYNECMTMAVVMGAMIPFIALIMLVGKINVWFIVVMMSIVVLMATGVSLVNTPYISMRFVKIGRNGTVSGIVNAMAALGIVVANFVSPRIADSYGWTAVIVAWIGFAVASVVLSLIAYIPWRKFIKNPEYQGE